MQSDFEKCLEFVLQAEGGFSDNPDDHGGATNHGIIQTEYDGYRRSHGLPLQSVREITGAEVDNIYRQSYWDTVHGDYVAMPLCMVLFDTAVNCGVGRAYELLNEALGLGHDMTWTQNTSARYHTLNTEGIETTSEQILRLRTNFYREIAKNPGQSQFLNGWLNRVADLRRSAGIA